MMESRALPATLAPISARRRRVDRLARWTLGVAAAVALVPLMLVLYYLIKRGIGVLSLSFFTTDPTGAFLGDPGGIKSAILGTIEIVAIASAISVPVGVATRRLWSRRMPVTSPDSSPMSSMGETRKRTTSTRDLPVRGRCA